MFRLIMLHFRQEITDQERRWAEEQMMKSYQTMINRYNEQRRQLKDRKPWVASVSKSGAPPSVMTVTHVNQTKDLFVR